jgi:ABC-2 type transport system permease protein
MQDLAAASWLGVRTLYAREVRRFMKIYLQTLLAPMVTTLLFLAVFVLALGRAVGTVGGVPFVEFLAPGLMMMAIAQNAFANSSSSMTAAKLQGNIVDTLMPPFTAGELTFGYAAGAATRGVVAGAAVAVAMAVFVRLQVHNPFFILFHGVAAAMMLGMLGLIGGIWADKFDHLAAVNNFVVTPLAFLSGTFYSIERLPEAFQVLAHLNPFFYMIDGFRYGFIGHADGSLTAGLAVMVGVDVALWAVCHRMFATGYKLKA